MQKSQELILAKAGLTGTQAEVFVYLLENGEEKASVIAKNTKRPRGVAYKALEELVELEIVEKIEKSGKIATFRSKHPSALEKMFENKEKQAKKDKEQFFASLGDFVSLYNLSTQKPGVSYFEGNDGMEKILQDALTSNTDIYMYCDIETMIKSATEINEKYGEKRKRLGIKKKIITSDTPFARKYLKDYNTEITEVRFIPHESFVFSTPSTLEIYDGKLSYVTINDKQKTGVLLHDRNMYMLHKQIFEFTWQCAKSLDQLS